MNKKKSILVIYHSQNGTMKLMAHRFAQGAAKEKEVAVILKKAGNASLEDLLNCNAIAISDVRLRFCSMVYWKKGLT